MIYGKLHFYPGLIIYSRLYRPTVEAVNSFAPSHARLFKEVSSTDIVKDRRDFIYIQYWIDDSGLKTLQAFRIYT